MTRKTLFCAALLAAGAAAPALAQENLLGELYGLGVHAYNSRDYREAYANLSAAVEGGSRDPRVYYFRGLALSNLGRASHAQADFAKGAQLEASTGGDQYAVGKALERIQGNQRLTIERVRKVAKIKFQQEQLAKSKAMYEQRQKGDVEPVLPTGPSEFANKALPMVDPSKPVEGDPFGAGDGLGVGAAEKAPVKPDPTAVAGPADPFGAGEREAPAAGGTADPFGGGEAPAAGAGDADPFGGGDAPAAGGGDADPFGGGDEPAAGGGDAPVAGEGDMPPAGEDPFGGDAGAPPAGDMPPAGAGEDPFGGDAGAAPPEASGGDPFGADAGAPAEGGAAPAAGGGGPVGGVIRGIGQALEGAAGPDGRDPFDNADEPKAGGPPAVTRPAVEPPAGGAAAGDPFADDPEEVAPPAGDVEPAADPFGG